MAQIDTFRFPGFDGIEVHVSRGFPQRDSFALNVWECLQHIRRFPTGDILLNQIKFAVPLAASTHSAANLETRAINFDISTNVVIIPVAVEYVQAGYHIRSAKMEESPSPGHNPPRGAFWRRALSRASTEALDQVAAGTPGQGSKSLIRFSNAILATNMNSPAFIILAHELIHAMHNLYGHRWDGQEEERTTGVGKFDDYLRPLVTENEIRREAGLPVRATYQPG